MRTCVQRARRQGQCLGTFSDVSPKRAISVDPVERRPFPVFPGQPTFRYQTNCAAEGHSTEVDIRCYSITLSAPASTACGTTRPIALAVLRLTAISYVFGA